MRYNDKTIPGIMYHEVIQQIKKRTNKHHRKRNRNPKKKLKKKSLKIPVEMIQRIYNSKRVQINIIEKAVAAVPFTRKDMIEKIT